jgi:hypothetical protein
VIPIWKTGYDWDNVSDCSLIDDEHTLASLSLMEAGHHTPANSNIANRSSYGKRRRIETPEPMLDPLGSDMYPPLKRPHLNRKFIFLSTCKHRVIYSCDARTIGEIHKRRSQRILLPFRHWEVAALSVASQAGFGL